MTSPIDTRAVSREYILIPTWNDNVARVSTSYRDSDSTDPVHRMVIPPGVWVVDVDNEYRLNVTPVMTRNGRDKTFDAIISDDSFQIQTESQAELVISLSVTPNTNDQATARIGVIMTRMAGFDI